MKQYLVIGLGRFGTSVAKTLYEAEKNVLAIDIDEDNVQDKIDTNLIIDTDIKERLKFSDNFVLVEVKAPSTFWNNSLINLDVRNKYNINIVGIKKAQEEFIPNPTANDIIEEGDILMIIADKKAVESFNKLI